MIPDDAELERKLKGNIDDGDVVVVLALKHGIDERCADPADVSPASRRRSIFNRHGKAGLECGA
jgi:hypothetical protein